MAASKNFPKVAAVVSVRHYKDPQNDSPFKKWFDRLDASAVDIVNDAIRKRVNGIVAHSDPVGKGVHELKQGKYRVYYGNDGDELIVLLGGGTKQRQQNDIDTAKDRWLDYRERKKTHLAVTQSPKTGKKPTQSKGRKSKRHAGKGP